MTTPTAVQIDAVLKHLSRLPKSGLSIDMAEAEFSSEIDDLVRDLHDNGFVQMFDWVKWQPQALCYVETPSMLEQADLRTLVMLLTLHVRKERFCEGHIAAMVESGHIGQLLARLQECRSD